jgi:hypothetical protein
VGVWFGSILMMQTAQWDARVLRHLKVGSVDFWQMFSRDAQKIMIRFVRLALVGMFFWALFVFFASDRPEAMIPPTLEWGRLAPFPTSAKNFEITTEGSSFSRAFRASFIAPAADVQRWLRESPGTRDVRPKPESANVMRYKITPGGGAAHAEVTVENGMSVKIYVYWS